MKSVTFIRQRGDGNRLLTTSESGTESLEAEISIAVFAAILSAKMDKRLQPEGEKWKT